MASEQGPVFFDNISKLATKLALIIVPFILSCLMRGIISLINMLRTLGWIEGFLSLIVLLLLLVVRKITGLW